MKKILMTICDMRIGGAQRGLLSFLQALEEDGRIRDYEVHLLLFNPTGEFLRQLPSQIHVEQPGRPLRWMGAHMSTELLTRYFSLRGLVGEVLWVLRQKLPLLPKELNRTQRLWHSWKRLIPAHPGYYDAAISCIDGATSCYVMDKVSAARKVLWLHSDYQQQSYDPAFDEAYYRDCDAIVTVSARCRETFLNAFPQLADKVHVLPNITSASRVLEMSRTGSCPEFDGAQGLKLLTVARLHAQKGVDIAVEAARHLRDASVAFRWLVVGEGSERARLEELIGKYALSDHMLLIGARENPYGYMRECDMLVQPSRVEGKSIVLDEAKLLCKPIVATAYPTVGDAIEDGVTGVIAGKDGASLCQGILRMQEDELRRRITENLGQLPADSEAELQRYLDIMF